MGRTTRSAARTRTRSASSSGKGGQRTQAKGRAQRARGRRPRVAPPQQEDEMEREDSISSSDEEEGVQEVRRTTRARARAPQQQPSRATTAEPVRRGVRQEAPHRPQASRKRPARRQLGSASDRDSSSQFDFEVEGDEEGGLESGSVTTTVSGTSSKARKRPKTASPRSARASLAPPVGGRRPSRASAASSSQATPRGRVASPRKLASSTPLLRSILKSPLTPKRTPQSPVTFASPPAQSTAAKQGMPSPALSSIASPGMLTAGSPGRASLSDIFLEPVRRSPGAASADPDEAEVEAAAAAPEEDLKPKKRRKKKKLTKQEWANQADNYLERQRALFEDISNFELDED